MRPPNSLLGSFGCGGGVNFARTSRAKFRKRYLVGPHTVLFSTKMRNDYLNGDQTAWAHTYTGIKQLAFLRTIFTLPNSYLRDGEEGFIDFANRLKNVEDLKT